MKRLLIQIVVGGMLSAATAATAPAEDPMAGFYGNTATVAVPPYYYAKRFIDPDGTWREPRGDGWIKGVWKLESGQVCSWQTEPATPSPRRYCYAAVPRKVGDEWVTTDPDTGNEVITRIEPGRN